MSIEWMVVFGLAVFGLYLIIVSMVPQERQRGCLLALGILSGIILLFVILNLAGVVDRPFQRPLIK